MKIIKGLMLFALLVVCASSCFNPPEFSNTPKISLEDIYFGVSPGNTKPDSVVLSIKFQDGDGDLGLEDNPQSDLTKYLAHSSDPFHPKTYFLANGGDLIPVSTYTAYTDETPPRYFTPVLNLGESQEGKLATDRTREDPPYTDLPPNVFPDECYHYTETDLYVVGGDARVLDNSYNIIDTMTDFTVPVYIVHESFYTEKNPNNFNIEVEWFVYNVDSAKYVVFNWEEQNAAVGCAPSFDGRFPVISQSDNALEGVIHYSMKSNGFLILFSTSKFKLRIQIKDLALNRSNYIETEELTLQDIRRQ